MDVNQPIRIAIAEDHELVRQGMVALLKDEPGIEVVFAVSNGEELVNQLWKSGVEVILLDLEMPIMNGYQALKIINEKFEHVRVIIISMFYSDEFISESIVNGARGFLPKNCDIEKVVESIHAVKDHGYYFDDKISKALLVKLINHGHIESSFAKITLSKREIEVVELICEGKQNKEIGEILFISTRTVETHRKKIAKKTNAKNVAEVVIFAIRTGIYKIPLV